MGTNDLGTPVNTLLWISLRIGLEALGESFLVKENADGFGDGNSQKAIMPLKLMLSMMILVLILSIAFFGFAATWIHCLHVVPTRVMVLAPSKSKKTQTKSWVSFGPWHYAPICVFWFTRGCGWLVVSLGTTFLPTHEFGRHVTNIAVAVLLCPLQLAATFAALETAYPKDTEHPSMEKKSQGDASTDCGSMPPRRTRTRLLHVLKILAEFYSVLAPTTLHWAVAAELSKAGARRLSRYLSLTQYVASGDPDVFYSPSNAHTIFTAGRAACVLALFVFLWTALVLPATIGMRRMHASWCLLVVPHMLRSVSIDENLWSKRGKLSASFLRPWLSLGWQQYGRLLAIYAASFSILAFVAVAGFYFYMLALVNPLGVLTDHGRSFPDEYLGWWTSLFLHLKMAYERLFFS